MLSEDMSKETRGMCETCSGYTGDYIALSQCSGCDGCSHYEPRRVPLFDFSAKSTKKIVALLIGIGVRPRVMFDVVDGYYLVVNLSLFCLSLAAGVRLCKGKAWKEAQE